MSCTYFVGIWCLLTITLQTVYTNDGSDDGTQSIVNYSQLQTSITRSKSIFIYYTTYGTKKDLEKWLPTVENEEDKNDDTNTKTMYTFLKCECADYIKTATIEISEILTNGKTHEDNITYHRVISRLSKLNKPISLAINTLLAISDNYTNLKSHEPYFLRTLIMTNLYIESKLDVNQNLRNNNWSHELLKMKRIVLQITNLVQVFTSEHCYSTTDYEIENDVQNQSHDFDTFLTTVVTSDMKLEYPLIDDFMFSKCVVSYANTKDTKLKDFCKALSTKPKVRQAEKKGILRTLGELHDLVRVTYDVNDLFEYMLIVYKVILKLIYKETRDNFIEIIAIPSDQLKEIKKKLQKMNCPIEIINHIELLLKIQTHREPDIAFTPDKTVTWLNSMKVNSLVSYVNLGFKLSDLNITFTEFMDIILDDQFRNFWSVFDLLHRESETRSIRVYDLTLHLFQKGFGSIFSDRNKNKCNALTNIYINWLEIKSANKKSLKNILNCFKNETQKPLVAIKEHFQRIRDRNTTFSNYLLDTFNDEIAVEYLEKDDGLLNIIINAIIYLKDESNTDVNDATILVSARSDLVKLMVDKHEKLSRMGLIIMDFLDNYQIRNCKDINDRNYIYQYKNVSKHAKDENLYPIYFDKAENNTEPVQTAGNQTVQHKRRVKTAKKYKKILYDAKRIPRDFYDISLLTSQPKMEEIRSLGKNIYFDWHGGKKNIRQMQMEVTKNMLNIRDIVEYQRMYIKGTFLYLLEKKFGDTPEEHSEELAEVHANDYDLTSKKSYKLFYSSNSVVVFAFYRVLNFIYNSEVPFLYGVNMVCLRSNIYGLVQMIEAKSLSVSNHKTKSDQVNDEMFDVCSAIWPSRSDIKDMISKNAIIFNQSKRSFKFITPIY